MRIIPVIDLKDGLAVHAVKGERQAYQPVKSVLLDTAAPLALANAFRQKIGAHEAYIADLDAILHARPQFELIAELAHGSELNLIVDAGIHDPHSALELLSTGASKVIIGAETLTTWDELQDIQDHVPGEKLVFSLDMRNGKILSLCPALNTLSPLDAIQRLYASGWQEIILLDLARVGTQSGIDLQLIAAVRQKYPDLKLLVGGGIRDINDLRSLKSSGVSGVLVATILHLGLLNRDQISALG
jgi:phosphoribosylformimino-5-aminoimidazole carboxamide ribotide isomerase